MPIHPFLVDDSSKIFSEIGISEAAATLLDFSEEEIHDENKKQELGQVHNVAVSTQYLDQSNGVESSVGPDSSSC